MIGSFIVLPEAENDLSEATRWYNVQRAGLGDEFLDMVLEFASSIGAMPERHEVVLKDIRRAKLPKFPYAIYYRSKVGRIEIMGVIHGSRDDRVWQSRLDIP